MKNSIVNFTRGTQLLGHFGFMFAAGFKLPLVVSVLVVLATVWWRVSSMLTDYQAYLLWMHVYASAYGKYFSGLTASPPILIVKCKCTPVE